MKKTMFIIVSFVVMLLTLSASVDKGRYAQLGKEAPALVAGRAGSAASLQGLRGKKVILSFWSAGDAESRVMQTKIAALARKAGAKADNVEVMSINFDRSERLMDEIVRIDNLDESSQFHVGSPDEARALRDAFSMHNGLRTFIIDTDGTIEAVDPTDTQIARVLG